MAGRANLKWIAACLVVAICFASVPFLWRSSLATWIMLAACLLPIWFVLALVFGVRWLKRNPVHLASLAAGAALVVGGAVFAFSGDAVARSAIFNLNYRQYREVASMLVREGSSGSQQNVAGFGVERSHVELRETSPILIIETASGPTLETVVFSVVPMGSYESYRLRKIRIDDLGHWYFADPDKRR